MKFIIAMQNKLDAAKRAAFNCLKKQDGQNTVEYIIMLTVVVAVVLVVGAAMRSMMPEVFDNVKQKILGGINSSGN